MSENRDSPPVPMLKWSSASDLGTATIHEAQGRTGAMVHDIKPLDPAMRLSGPAFTVAAKAGQNLIVHHAVVAAAPGDILVIDAEAYVEAGLWGDVLTEAARHAGIAGLIVDGAVRDADAICRAGFPVFARALSIKGALKQTVGQLGIAVTCGGVVVSPGDLVVGDRDGVVVVPARQAETVLQAAAERNAYEAALCEQIRQGRTTVDLMAFTPLLASMGLSSRKEP